MDSNAFWEKAWNCLDVSLHSGQIWCLLFPVGDQWDLVNTNLHSVVMQSLCVLLVNSTIRFLSFHQGCLMQERPLRQFQYPLVKIIVLLLYFLDSLLCISYTKDIQETNHFPMQSLSWQYSDWASSTWIHCLLKGKVSTLSYCLHLMSWHTYGSAGVFLFHYIS